MRIAYLLPVLVWTTLTSLFCVPLRADSIDALVQAELKLSNVPGVAVAVTQGGQVTKLAGYGLANVEQGTRVTPQTVFQIQSVTKQFVATAIMMLVEDGKVSVSAPVSKYLEGAPEIWEGITLRHLLTHTSGIKDFINEPTASLRLDVTDEEVFQATKVRPLNFQPGERYAYSNSNYHLLAMIIRKVTGRAYGEFLKERVFQPLGMDHTRVVSWSDIIPQRAAGYGWRDNRLCNGQFVAGSILAYGGGGLVSTAEDMAKWDLGLRGEKLLKRSALDQMWSRTKLNSGAESGYGFGWGGGGKDPHRWVEHSGGHVTGFTSHIVRFLDDDISVVVLMNAGFGNPGKLAHRIAEQLVPGLKLPERKPIEDTEPKVTELLRRTEQMVRQRQLEPEPFTLDMLAALRQSLTSASESLQSLGPVQKVELLERKPLDDGFREYQYRARFEGVNLLVHLVLDKEGKIAGLSQELE